MSGFFIFEVKGANMDTIFSFLKNWFSVMSTPMDMIFGLPSENNVRLLKHTISQFFSKYSKSYNILNIKKVLKTQRPLAKTWAVLRPSNYMYLVELSKTLPLFLMYFQNHYLVLSHIRFFRLQKMLFILQKSVFIENKAAELCANGSAQSWLQYGIKVFDKILVLQKTEMCDPPSKCYISET